MEWLAKVVVVAFAVWALWTLCQPRCAFVVRVTAGEPKVVRGTVTPAFLQQVRELCCRHGVEHARVRGVFCGRRISLAFSRGVPPAAQQQLRNWWVMSGWSAGPHRA